MRAVKDLDSWHNPSFLAAPTAARHLKPGDSQPFISPEIDFQLK